ncbi:MAG: XRE family transcriptional regulator [Gammaproteobacteria bacterium]|nr:XRE family transcriptional regulator [Gammaproteobacteria bacterium]
MRKRTVKGLEVEKSSGNIFADLGLPNAEKLKTKSGLVIQIIKAARRLGLSQEKAGQRMGLPLPKVLGLFRRDFANVSERKLIDCLNRLG